MNILEVSKLSPAERRDFFDSYSTETKEQVYMKPLSREELEIKREELAQAAMQKALLDEQLTEYKKTHKASLEPHVKAFTERLKEIKNKSVQVTGMAYKIPDYDNQAIHILGEDGTVINTRPMLPEERQFTIQSQLKDAL